MRHAERARVDDLDRHRRLARRRAAPTPPCRTSPSDRCTDTIASAPPSAAALVGLQERRRATGRDVLTGATARSASATVGRGDVDALGVRRRRRRRPAAARRGCPRAATTARRQVGRRVGDDGDVHGREATGRAQPATMLTSLGARTMTLRTLPAVQRRARPSGWPAPAARSSSSPIVGGDLDPVAHLALHLHDAGDRVVHQQRRVGHRERRRTPATRSWPSRAHSSSAMCGASGASISTSGSATSRGTPVQLGQVVVQLDQLGDRGVEPQRVHVGAHRVDRAVQQPARRVVGRRRR